MSFSGRNELSKWFNRLQYGYPILSYSDNAGSIVAGFFISARREYAEGQTGKKIFPHHRIAGRKMRQFYRSK
jgi:hypothetical protein